MIRRAAIVASSIAILCAPAWATASIGPHGRSTRTEAVLDAQVATDATSAGDVPVQILTQLCRRPWKLRGCDPMPARMQAALGDAIDAPITWVERRHRRGPEFLVFAPVRIGRDQARAAVAWWDRGRFGCHGYATLEFARRRGTWVGARGMAWVACPALG